MYDIKKIYFIDKNLSNQDFYENNFIPDIEKYWYNHDEIIKNETYIVCYADIVKYGYDLINDTYGFLKKKLKNISEQYLEINFLNLKKNINPKVIIDYFTCLRPYIKEIYNKRYFYLIHDIAFDDYNSKIEIYYKNKECYLDLTHHFHKNIDYQTNKDHAHIFSKEDNSIDELLPIENQALLNFDNNSYEIIKFYYSNVINNKINKIIKICKTCQKLGINKISVL